ncbi:MFS transporter [Sediminivirga luteola]|uniref:Putative proline/betaine transporter n=1 Tax=Sediminivirga luteola TaxID=1774748 RepID=A0A8J2U0P1_9MICO|nr:MFS transporter [Sediminivirga luteola]MCI2264508.1 MFS transporter [Sediminivirga luteola]GGA25697.1 MFS transporter [Sediminivirga luteola]
MSTESASHLRRESLPQGAKRAVFASSFGNLMESYDNLVYGYLAVYIGQLFFPTTNETASLLATFATFAVGFVARPLGTLIFGHLGDKFGRKLALLLSVIGMAAVTVMIGLLPTYQTIGVLAPILLVLLRMCQGIAVAGEWSGSAAVLVEYAPSHRRGFFGSFNQVSTAGGFLLASGVVTGLTTILDDEQMLAWGWRIPFLLGALTGIAAIVLRYGMKDTPAFREEKAKDNVVKAPLTVAIKTQFPAIVRGFGFTVVWTVAYFFFLTYVPTFLSSTVGVDPGFARFSNFIVLIYFMLLIAPFGLLSDRIGRKPLLLVGSGGFLLLSFPALYLMTTGSHALILVAQFVIATILAAFSGAGIAALSEFFPTNVRYSALGIGYNFSVMAFGGTAPFIGTAVVSATGVALSAALLPTVAGLITLIVIVRMRETYKEELR